MTPTPPPPQRQLKVALAGATGNLGQPILHHLLSTPSIHITILTRHNTTTTHPPPHPNLSIKPVDFTSVPSLLSALQSSSIKIVISCLATLALSQQTPLIDACILSGVSRFIPAEFGMDSLNPHCRSLPVCAPKVMVQQYLTTQTQIYPWFSWTGIANGLFLDWGLEVGFIADVKKCEVTYYNGGDVPFSATTLGDVAKAVLGVVVQLEEERLKNRVVYVHSAVVTQRMLVGFAREKNGREWRVREKDTEVLRKECLGLLEEGKVEEAMLGFCAVASWSKEYGCDFSGRGVDNALLGVEGLDEEGVRGVVERVLEC